MCLWFRGVFVDFFSEVFQLGMAISADKPGSAGLMQFLLRAHGKPILALQSGGFESRVNIQLWNKLSWEVAGVLHKPIAVASESNTWGVCQKLFKPNT